jgi:hypothetical protein
MFACLGECVTRKVFRFGFRRTTLEFSGPKENIWDNAVGLLPWLGICARRWGYGLNTASRRGDDRMQRDTEHRNNEHDNGTLYDTRGTIVNTFDFPHLCALLHLSAPLCTFQPLSALFCTSAHLCALLHTPLLPSSALLCPFRTLALLHLLAARCRFSTPRGTGLSARDWLQPSTHHGSLVSRILRTRGGDRGANRELNVARNCKLFLVLQG